MIPQQQMQQLQQIQIQPNAQGQYVTSQDTHQQIQNQILQSQQMAMQQQAQNNLNTSQANAQIQQITIQQPKQQILIGQQSTAQSQASISMENRPIMTMVSIGGGSGVVSTGSNANNAGNNTISSFSGMQNLGSPINLPQQHLPIQPPPNPLAAMTSLSYSAQPSGILTNSTANIMKDDKNTIKMMDDTQKSSSQSTAEPTVLISTSTTHGTTVTTVANGSITISSATSTPVTSLASNNKPSGKYFLSFYKIQSKSS